jgi:NAD+ diphosphatase
MPFLPSIVPPSSVSRRIWFFVSSAGLIVREIGLRVELPANEEASHFNFAEEHAHYLGQLEDAHAFVVPYEGEAPSGFVARGLRSFFGAMDEDVFWVAGRALQLAEWATTHRFCGRCATPTVRVHGERAMKCPSCQYTTYPRISPAIIVLVRRGDEALLARGARFPRPFYSTLAGFSEVGESLEETLQREVREEVGIEVKNIRYFGSQPWPFPHSLMIGFFAEYAGGELNLNKEEILDAKWFRADDLPMIPPGLSIARKLIDNWIAEVSPGSQPNS